MRRHRRDDGAAALEFAIVLPVLLGLIFFALYGAMLFYYHAVADHVARTVARQVSIPTGGAYPGQAAATTDAGKATGSLMPAPSSVSLTAQPDDGTPQEGDLVTVTVSYQLPLLSQLSSVIPGLSGIDSLSGSATERRQ